MILLSAGDITTVQHTGPGVSQTTVTDTLYITSVTIDLTTGALYATIQRGTGTPFVSNLTTQQVTVNPDGSFISSDGTWTGSVGTVAATLVTSLRNQFDQFILASGAVTGTEIQGSL
jgi:hypothetical protein